MILTGYLSTGKSSIGKILADLLGFDFIDTDEAIEKRQGETIAEMVGRGGWDLFRSKEENLLLELAQNKNKVIATGGGSVMHEKAWKNLRKNSIVVWLTADIKTICNRLAADSSTDDQRPPLTEMGTMDEISMVISERLPLYEKSSDLKIDTEGKTPEEVAETILAEFKKGN
ncbi:MAG: shikimate kinase [Deltaproteobacteria bacterium]|nr:shikimate kinase [Deltaproteobacteria bacterium]